MVRIIISFCRVEIPTMTTAALKEAGGGYELEIQPAEAALAKKVIKDWTSIQNISLERCVFDKNPKNTGLLMMLLESEQSSEAIKGGEYRFGLSAQLVEKLKIEMSVTALYPLYAKFEKGDLISPKFTQEEIMEINTFIIHIKSAISIPIANEPDGIASLAKSNGIAHAALS